MADLQRIDPQVVTQPTGFQVPSLAAQTSARNAEQLSKAIPSLTDQIVQVANPYLAEQGARDAAKLLEPDGSGKVQPPASMKPPGWSFNAYSQSYETTLKSLYFDTARSEFDNYRRQQEVKFPTDPAKVTELLASKKQSMLEQMGSDYKPFMAVTMNGMMAQSVTSVANNLENENHSALVAKANRAMIGFAEDAARSAAWTSASVGQKPYTLGGIDEKSMKATFGMMKADWDQRIYPLLKQAGASDSAIETYYEKTQAKAIAARAKGYFSSVDLAYPAGHERAGMPDGEKKAQFLDHIRTISVGPYAPEIEQGARMGLADAEARAAGMGQAKAADREDAIMSNYRGTQQQVFAIQNDPRSEATDLERRSRIEQLYRDERSRMLFDGRLNTADTIKSMALLDQAHNVVNTENQRYFGTQIVQLAKNTTASELTPSQNTEAKNQLQDLVRDPTVSRMLSPALMAHAEQAIGHFYRAKSTSDVAGFVEDARRGMIPDSQEKALLQGFVERGQVGSTPAAVATLSTVSEALAQGAKVKAERAKANELAGQAVKVAGEGGVPNEMQARGWSMMHPFQPYGPDGKKQTFNANDPSHIQQFLAEFQMSHVVDPTVKKAIEDLPWAGTPEAAANVGTLYAGMAKILEDRAPPGQRGGAHAALSEMLGPQVADFARLVKQTGSPELAIKQWGNRSTSSSGNAGEATTKMQEQMIQSVEQNLADPESRWLLNQGILGKSIAVNASSIQKNIQGIAEQSGSATSWFGLGGAGFSTIVINDSGLKKEFADRMSRHVIGNGDLNQAVTGERKKDAFDLALTQMKGGLELVPDPADPSRGLLQRPTTRTLAAKALGQDISMVHEDDARRYYGAAAASYQRVYGRTGDTPIDMSTVKAEEYLTDTGTKMVRISDRIGGFKPFFGPQSGGTERVLAELPPDHEIFTLGPLLKEKANMHIRNIVGPGPSPELQQLGTSVAAAYAGEMTQSATNWKDYAQVKMFRQSFEMLQIDKALRQAAGEPDYIQDPTKLFTRRSEMPRSEVIAQWEDRLKNQNEAERRQRIDFQQGLILNKALKESGESGLWLPIYMGHQMSYPPSGVAQPAAPGGKGG